MSGGLSAAPGGAGDGPGRARRRSPPPAAGTAVGRRGPGSCQTARHSGQTAPPAPDSFRDRSPWGASTGCSSPPGEGNPGRSAPGYTRQASRSFETHRPCPAGRGCRYRFAGPDRPPARRYTADKRSQAPSLGVDLKVLQDHYFPNEGILTGRGKKAAVFAEFFAKKCRHGEKAMPAGGSRSYA